MRAASMSPFPVIDTHIHIFDKTKPGSMPYPRDMPGGGEPPQGAVALPNRYAWITEPYGVVGAIIVEASSRLEDNFWWLDVARDNPVIVGVVGNLPLGDDGCGRLIDRFASHKLYRGIRTNGDKLLAGLQSPAGWQSRRPAPCGRPAAPRRPWACGCRCAASRPRQSRGS